MSGATLKGTLSGSSCAVNASSNTTRVVFWADNAQINNDYGAPWNCNFNTTRLRDGSYTLRAVAYNDREGSSTTASIPITINNSGTASSTNTAPTVSFASPASGQTVSGSISYAANASDNGGVSRVDFFLDGAATALLSDASSPYGGSLDTTRLANGTHTLTATAYDAQGLKTSTQVSFNVQNSTGTNTGSTGSTTATPGPFSGSLNVWYKAPANGATISGVLNGGTSCYANTSGSPARVVFSMDGSALNTDSTPSDGTQCVLDTTKFANGTHSLRADVYDASGNQKTDIISVNVQNTVANKAPTVSVTAPGAGQTVSGSLAYAANASDDAGVAKVDFALDATALASDSSSPYGGSLDTTKLANGTHTLTATAWDAQGLKSTSQVSFNVQNSTGSGSTGGSATPAPFSGSLDVWYKAPASGATISGVLNGGTSCYANTSGSPVRVAFTVDGKALNTDTTPADGTQCVLDTTKLANGTHSLRADAYDASGNTRTDIISVNVQNAAPNSAPTVSFSSPSAGQTVSASIGYAANASDDKAVSKVDFFLDGATTALLSDAAAPYGGSLDTAKLPNGTHSLTATAYDAEGLKTSTQVSFNVQNTTSSGGGSTGGATATPAPTSGTLNAWFKAPLSGSTIKGVLNGGTSCYVNTSGSVAKVAFSMDSTAISTDTTPADGTQCVLDTTKFANGTHTLSALATDTSGKTYLERISVNVQNASSGGSNSGGSGSGSTLPAGGKAVTTFHSIGLYWTPSSNPGSAGCIVQYRKSGDSTWSPALNLWYDSRNNECRGSIVQVQPGTSYDVQMGVGSTYSVQTTATTWSEQFPVAQTITVGSQSGTLSITQGGSASGYVLYQAAPGAVINGGSGAQAIKIDANYVIVRGFTVKGGNNGIEIMPGRHDVVIEQNDVSAWGRYNYTNSSGWKVGVDEDSGITARCYNNVGDVYRVVVQRNKVHDPNYGANSWDWGHPAGPNAISAYECGGNNVIRYNEVWSSDQQHYYMDGLGGGNNDSNKGWPGADSDIYGNSVKNTWDDGIEAEGGGQNVRVWGNYVDNTAVGIATTPVAIGPTYVFRNVYNRSRMKALVSLDNDERNNFSKSGSWSDYGNGRRYLFHNTTLQATTSGLSYPLGAGGGILNSGSSEPMTNTVSRNNILQIWKTWWTDLGQGSGGQNNDVDYDLYNGGMTISGGETHGIVGVPVYASGNGWQSESGGMYQLAPSSPGYGKGARIPNFNDDVAAPDIGAHQSGKPAMKFGVNQ